MKIEEKIDTIEEIQIWSFENSNVYHWNMIEKEMYVIRTHIRSHSFFSKLMKLFWNSKNSVNK